MSRPKLIGICSVENCEKPLAIRGMCRQHYNREYWQGNLEKIITGDKREHPLYHLWFDRKQAKALCDEWANDFWKFIENVSPKPEGSYFLVRLRNEPFGPTNFKWQEHLKRKKGETNKEWWARKWAARQAANPGIERARNLKRFYGFTVQQFDEILWLQNRKCAICKQAETAVEGKTGTIKRLAIDHCHNSNKVRGLLCSRCNTTLGKVEDSVELLQEMIDYLLKHKEPDNV